MNKSKLLSLVIVIFLICVLLGSLIFGADSANTVTATSHTAESLLSGEGIVTFYSELINASSDGHALFSAQEGKLIKKYSTVASVYTGEISDEMAEQLKLLNDKITFNKSTEKYKSEVFNDIGSLNKEINNQFSDIINNTASGNYSDVYELKSRILTYHEKALAMKGEQVPAPQSENDNAKIAELEKTFSVNKTVYTSPVDGMFSPRIDNFDTLVNPDSAQTLTPKSYKDIIKNDIVEVTAVEKDKPFAKIINNFEWYLVSSFSSADVKDLEVGDEVSIRVSSISDSRVKAKIIYISEEEKKERVMVIKSTKYIDGIFAADKVEFEIVKNSYKGLKIPTSAIVKKDSKEGIYSVKDGVYKFVEIKVLYRDKNYVIIEDRSSEYVSGSGAIVLYDLVVTNPEKVREGSIAGGAL